MAFSILDLINNPTQRILEQMRAQVASGRSPLETTPTFSGPPTAEQGSLPTFSARRSKPPEVVPSADVKTSAQDPSKVTNPLVEQLSQRSTQELQDMLAGKTLERLGLPNKFRDPAKPKRSARKLKKSPYYPTESDSIHGVLSAIATEGTYERQAAMNVLELRQQAEADAMARVELGKRRERFGEQVAFELGPFQGIPHRMPDPSRVPAMLFQGLQSGLMPGEDYARASTAFDAERDRSVEIARDEETKAEHARVQNEREWRRQYDIAKLAQDKADISLRASQLGLTQQQFGLELRKYADTRRNDYISSGASRLAADYLANSEVFGDPEKFGRDPIYQSLKTAISLIGDSKADFASTLNSTKEIIAALKDKDSLTEETVTMYEQVLESLARRLGGAAVQEGASNFGSAWEQMNFGANPTLVLKKHLPDEDLSRISKFFGEGFRERLNRSAEQPSSAPDNAPPGLFEGTAIDTILQGAKSVGGKAKRSVGMLPSTVSRDIRTRLGTLPRNAAQFESLYGISAPAGYDTMTDREKEAAATKRMQEFIDTGK